MSINSTSFGVEKLTSAVADGQISSTARSYTSGVLVFACFSAEDGHYAGNTFTISNDGAAQTWTLIGSQSATGSCPVAVWWCVMSVTQTMTITAKYNDLGFTHKSMLSIVTQAGQHPTNPVPAGKAFSGALGSDVTQSITPTANGSCLWMWAADWTQTNSFAGATGCTVQESGDDPGGQSAALIRPLDQPRVDTSAFTIGETDSTTSGAISWVAFEVQANPSANNSLPCSAGTYAVTGQSALVAKGSFVTSAAGSYAVSGQAATFLSGYGLQTATGSYVVTGQDASLHPIQTLQAGAGAFIMTGSDGFSDFVVSAAVGSYTITGQDTTLPLSPTLACASGVYSVTGQSLLFVRGYPMAGEQGTFSLTGQDIGLGLGQRGAADGSSYVLTGRPALFSHGRSVIAGSSSFALTGGDIQFGRAVSADSGVYTLTGQSVALPMARSFPAAAGSFLTTGVAATFKTGRAVIADAATYAVTGSDATLTYRAPGIFALSSGAGSYSVSGQSVGLLGSLFVPAEGGIYAITGQSVASLVTYAITALQGVYSLTPETTLLVKRGVADLMADLGLYSVVGVDATLTFIPRVSTAIPVAGGEVLIKSPSETIELAFDFTEFASGGTLTTYSVNASQSGLTIVRAELASGVLTVAISGGLADWKFILGGKITRADGLIKESRVEIQVIHPSLDPLDVIDVGGGVEDDDDPILSGDNDIIFV